MKLFTFLVMLALFQLNFLFAQNGDLMVRSSDKGLYLEHKVKAKETYYSVGRLYNLSPRQIASFNGLDMNKGLNIDQHIRIPLLDTNFVQTGNSGTPVYYKVGDKEGLQQVSRKNNNVSIANLRLWNNLTNDILKKDAKLIIGFLQSSEMKAVTITPGNNSEKTIAKKEEKTITLQSEITDLTKKQEKKVSEAEEKAEKKEEKKSTTPVTVTDNRKPVAEGQGYFKPHFEQQVKAQPLSKDETVTAGIFKTVSGWEDGKYYLLIDDVQPGTIVRIVNPSNNKVVFAKVLGEMAGIRQNIGYQVRISNAAAATLGISETDKFILKINY